MVTIVKHRRTGNEYILLGVNGEDNKTTPSRFINELFDRDKSEGSCSATVCDVRGNIFLAYIDDLIVVEIDGKKPADILPEPTYETVNQDRDIEREEEDNFAREDLATDDFEDDFANESKVNPQVSADYNLDTQDLDADDEEEWI